MQNDDHFHLKRVRVEKSSRRIKDGELFGLNPTCKHMIEFEVS